jgi:hypothetical protein
MRKTLAALALILALTACSAPTAPDAADGSGTLQDPYASRKPGAWCSAEVGGFAWSSQPDHKTDLLNCRSDKSGDIPTWLPATQDQLDARG